MNLAINPNPYVRSPRSTFKIMMELLAGLCVVWLAAIIYYFVKGSPTDGIFAIVNVVIAVVTCVATETLFMLPKFLKENKTKQVPVSELFKKVLNSYGYISGLILALLLPVGVVWWQIVITSIATMSIGKMLFGGFGYNIFNPAIIGRVFAQICFGSTFAYGHVANASSFEVFSGATMLTEWSSQEWNMTKFVSLTDNGWSDLLLGNYRGSLGETFTLIIIIIGVILAVRKVIDWKIPVAYLGTCFLTSLIVGAMGGQGIDFSLAQLLTGGIVFGAVFCLTDPVTSPTSPLGKIFYGVFAGFVTMIIRFRGHAAEGVAYSILAANMITPLIDSAFKGRTTDNFVKKAGITGGICTLMILVSCAYGVQFDNGVTYSYQVERSADNENVYSVIVDHTNEFGGGTANFAYVSMDVEVNPTAKTVVAITVKESGGVGGYGDYFLGITDQAGVYYEYQEAKLTILNNLKATYVTFTTPVAFEDFRKYDLTYFDATQYSNLNDINPEIVCGSTYSVSGYFFGVNRVIDVVEGK